MSLSKAQAKLLGELKRHELSEYLLTGPEKRTMRVLIRKGLARENWRPPAPGNDYGGTTIYSITSYGKSQQ